MTTVVDRSKYEAVIGLEIHAQLQTRAKIFAPEAVSYGNAPNTVVSPISLGHPGTLPVPNYKCIEHAIKIGLATQCTIASHCHFARKNYFYPDLPKGYQISQHTTPLCSNGKIEIRLKEGSSKWIRIERIHIEEDTGKSMHDQDLHDSLVDLNRAGIGLIEIVSEADMKTSEEAAAYVSEVRKLVRYLEICDGNMEEGSLRCDANVSVMKRGAAEWGTKVEVKNMNSISNVAKAIEYEIDRQITALESGERIIQQTRTWKAEGSGGKTVVMREKESSDDYRYFPEPDLQPLMVDEQLLSTIRAEIPELPHALYQRYTTTLGLSVDDATTLSEQKPLAAYFDRLVEKAGAKAASVWLLGPVKAYLNALAISIEEFPLSTDKIAGLQQLVDDEKVSFSVAKDQLFPALAEQPEAEPEEMARKMDLLLENDLDEIAQLADKLIASFPDKVAAYQAGQKGLLGFFMGQLMKATKGKADPRKVNTLLLEKLTGQ